MAALISEEQKQILDMLTSQYLTPAQISIRRHTTLRSVYKTISKLKKKGLLVGGSIRGFNFQGVPKTQGGSISSQISTGNLLRLHNIQENIQILQLTDKYLGMLQQGNKYEIDDITIMLHKDSIDLYTQTQLSFTGYSTDECYLKALQYFRKIYGKIENDLGISIDKVRHCNKKWVRQHIAETNSEVAQQANDLKERIVIHDQEDGKEAIVTDNSFNLDELEFVHPIKAKKDTDRVRKHLQDLRSYDSLTNHELSELMAQAAQINLETSKLVHYYGENVQSHVTWVKKGIEVFDKMEKALDRLNQASRVPKTQMTLKQFGGSI